MIRLWVIWEKDRRIAIGLPTLFSMTWIAIFVLTWYFLQSMQCQWIIIVVSLFPSTIYWLSLQNSNLVFSLPIPEFSGCYSTSSNTMLIMDWVLFMAFEIGIAGHTLFDKILHSISLPPAMLGLMLIKGIRACEYVFNCSYLSACTHSVLQIAFHKMCLYFASFIVTVSGSISLFDDLTWHQP